MNWYYDQGGQRQGPVEEAELDRLIASGTVRPETLVWCEGMANWAPLKEARPASGAAAPGAASSVPEGWIRCTATGRYFPPSQIVYLDGKPYSAEAKPGIVQGVMQSGVLPIGSDVERTGPAWEQREQLGVLPAIWQTIKTVLMDPNRTFATMKRDGGLGSPLLFNVIVASVGTIAMVLYQVIFQVGGMSMMPPEAREQAFPMFAGAGIGMFIAVVVAVPFFTIISTFITAGIMHLSLMICSGAKQGFETTLRTYCYATGAGMALYVIPLCGGTIGGLWGLVCLCMGLAKTHEIGTGRAVCAVLLPTVVCCVLFIVIFAAIMGTVMSAQGLKH